MGKRDITLSQLSKLSEEERTKYIDYIKSLKLFTTRTIKNKQYLLVHAGVYPWHAESLKDCIYKEELENFIIGLFVEIII